MIIVHPAVSHLNAFDSLLTMFGGNAKTAADIKPVEAEIVKRDFRTRAEVAAHRKEMDNKRPPETGVGPA